MSTRNRKMRNRVSNSERWQHRDDFKEKLGNDRKEKGEEERPYVCVLENSCETAFKDAAALRQHVRCVHVDGKNLRISRCLCLVNDALGLIVDLVVVQYLQITFRLHVIIPSGYLQITRHSLQLNYFTLTLDRNWRNFDMYDIDSSLFSSIYFTLIPESHPLKSS